MRRRTGCQRYWRELHEAFRNAYVRLGELRWKEKGDLWGKPQTAGESVEDYMVRVRRCAKRLDMKPEAVCEAVRSGLRPSLRLAILVLKLNGLYELVKAARVAEAVTPTTDNALSATVMEVMKASTKAQERQAAEMSALGNRIAKIAALEVASRDSEEARISAVGGKHA